MKYLVAIHHPDNFDPSTVDKATMHDIHVLNEEILDTTGSPMRLLGTVCAGTTG